MTTKQFARNVYESLGFAAPETWPEVLERSFEDFKVQTWDDALLDAARSLRSHLQDMAKAPPDYLRGLQEAIDFLEQS